MFKPIRKTAFYKYLKNEGHEISVFLRNDTLIRETLFSSNSRAYRALRIFNLGMSLIIFLPVVASFLNMNLPHFLGYLISALGIYLVWIFELITKSTLFEEIKTFTIMQVSLHSVFGMYLQFYDKYTYFDDFLHITGGMWLSLVLFPIILAIELTFTSQKLSTAIWKVNLSTFSLSVTLGTLWEVFEFLSDIIFRDYPGYRLAQQDSLFDTMTDLIYDCAGSILGIMLFWYLLRKLSKNRDIYNLLERIGKSLRMFMDRKKSKSENL